MNGSGKHSSLDFNFPYRHKHSFKRGESFYAWLALFYSLPIAGILKGKYHCTVDLLFDWFGLVCFANKNKKMLVVIQLLLNQ